MCATYFHYALDLIAKLFYLLPSCESLGGLGQSCNQKGEVFSWLFAALVNQLRGDSDRSVGVVIVFRSKLRSTSHGLACTALRMKGSGRLWLKLQDEFALKPVFLSFILMQIHGFSC